MNDKKERVYSEEDLCEYTILQKIAELEKQLKAVKAEASTLYETKLEANTAHGAINGSIGLINQDLQNTKTTLGNLNKVTPTDIGVKNNKLGLLHDTTWLTNQDAINLDGFTYDEATKTLKASGADTDIPSFELEVATEQERASFGFIDLYKHSLTEAELTLIKNRITNNHPILGKAIIDSTKYVSLLQPYVQDLTYNYIGGDCGTGIQTGLIISIITLKWMIFGNTLYVGSFYQVTLNYGLRISSYKLSMGVDNATIDSPSVYFSTINGQCVCQENEADIKDYSFTENKVISLFGKHSILVPKNSTDSNIDLYRHDLELTNDNDEELYFTYYSSSNLNVDSFTDLNTLLTKKPRYIMVNGFIKEADKLYQIVHINWNGTYDNSYYDYTSLGPYGVLTTDTLDRFYMVTDTVTTI